MDAKLIQQIRDQMAERKRISEMNTYRRIGHDQGYAEGYAEGLKKRRAERYAEGMEKGMEKERLANALKMKELGMDVAVICQVTGLTKEQLENCRVSLKICRDQSNLRVSLLYISKGE